MTTPQVYQAISAVQGELARQGISKARKNQQQGYQFRGIDDVYAALSPLLSQHNLCVIPRVLTREVSERQTKSGGINFNVAVHAEFDFVSAVDGSKHTCATFGEAQDTADKATNKAMSAAYKYAAFMTFAIPVEGEDDADAITPEASVKPANDPPPVKMIKDEDRDLIMTLAAGADVTIQTICEGFNVADLRDLTEKQANATVKRLKDIANQKAKEAKEAA